MFDPLVILAVICLYMGGLFFVARGVERAARAGRNLSNNPVVYALSMAVYCTAWTYYGSVGNAANSGMLFLTIYLGPTLAAVFWWTVLRKLVRIKTTHRITSIADFISSRYGKSQSLAAMATILALVGITPYIALQLKAVITTFDIISSSTGAQTSWVGPVVVGFMVLFTIIFGVRRIDPTERHPGMVMAVAVESAVKLFAFLAAGAFITFFLFDGFEDLFQTFSRSALSRSMVTGSAQGSSFMTWISYLILAMSAILFLPRQFHVSVVENFEESHIRTAIWLFPLYMLLINIFVVPIAMGGLLAGYPAAGADTFVLRLPLDSGARWLSLLVFLGGFSAATSMVMISGMTLATMVTNHLLMPLILWFPWLGFLRRYLLQCRWAALTVGILTGYWFAQTVGEAYLLANMGIMAFGAALQFAPTILGGLFWQKGSKAGAQVGLGSGLVLWAYTMLVPAFVKSGWLAEALLTDGPMGLAFLAPEHLFGMTAFDPVTNTVFWTLLVNTGGYVIGSYLFPGGREERHLAREFAGVMAPSRLVAHFAGARSVIDLAEKSQRFHNILNQYFPNRQVERMLRLCIEEVHLSDQRRISIVELADLYGEVEKILAGSIGAAAAHRAMKQASVFTAAETEALASAYADLLASIKISPQELKKKIDYYREREALLLSQAEEMIQKVQELETEISERKKVEAALQENEKRLQALFEANPDPVVVYDRQGQALFVNPAFTRVFGWSLEDIEDGRTPHVPEDLKHQFEEKIGNILQGQRTVTFESKRVTKAGTVLDVAVSAAAIRDESEKILRIVVNLTDTTAFKRLEAQLHQAQKMEAIGTLAGGIAHDFNNILSAVLGYTELAMYKVRDGKDNLQDLEKVFAAGERARNLVTQILSFSRQSDHERKPIQITPIIKEALKLLRASIPAYIEIRTDLPSNPGSISADPTQIHQVLMNLCTNASHAMQETGGVLEVALKSVVLGESDAARHTDLSPGPCQRLTVSDTGYGIEPGVMDRIFEPFFTTKGRDEGTGMGLSVVHGIVKSHGGAVVVYSEPGRGTTFHLFFPELESRGMENPAVDRSSPLPAGNEHILLVDDEEPLVDIGSQILRSLGYRVTGLVSSVKALEMFKADPESFDLVITDQTMPQMTGIELARELLAVRPQLPIILCTGFSSMVTMDNAPQLGLRSLVTKPLLAQELALAVRSALDSEDIDPPKKSTLHPFS